MDIVKLAKWKKDLIKKAFGKCKSNTNNINSSLSKSKSCATNRDPSFRHYLKKSFTSIATSTNHNHDHDQDRDDHDYDRNSKKKNKNKKKTSQVAPDGCFSVYVGPEKKRFVVRAEFANHALFRMLLEDAESEYGFNSAGPILLPCDVDLFYKVLAEMESCDDDDEDGFMRRNSSPGCSLVLCSPLHNSHNYGSYKRLSPSRFRKINNF